MNLDTLCAIAGIPTPEDEHEHVATAPDEAGAFGGRSGEYVCRIVWVEHDTYQGVGYCDDEESVPLGELDDEVSDGYDGDDDRPEDEACIVYPEVSHLLDGVSPYSFRTRSVRLASKAEVKQWFAAYQRARADSHA